MSARLSAALAAALAVGAAVAPAHAVTRALLVGVDDYEGPPDLYGAVNDVTDLAEVLRARGVEPVLLVDRAATRGAVLAAFRAMAAEAGPDDLLYVHFSGHGISIPDDDGDEEDGRDEAWLMQGFDEESAPGEMIVDDDLDALFREAGRPVLFVADACHSGSPARAAAAPTLGERLYRPRISPTRPPPLAPIAAASGDGPPVFAVGATADDRTLPEVRIYGRPRGALSYAVARAFAGAGDLDGDGRVVAREFEVYVRQTVRTLAASKQTPRFDVPDGERALMTVPPGRAPAGEELSLPTVAVHLSGGGRALPGAKMVGRPADADLVLDRARRRALNRTGDVVASGDRVLADPGRLVEAARVEMALTRLSLGRPVAIRMEGGDGLHREGDELVFVAEGVPGRFLTAFALTASGTVERLWPLGADDLDLDPWPTGKPFRLHTVVQRPLGADVLVLVASDDRPGALRAALDASPIERRPALVWEGLAEAARHGPVWVGLQAFFSTEGPP